MLVKNIRMSRNVVIVLNCHRLTYEQVGLAIQDFGGLAFEQY